MKRLSMRFKITFWFTAALLIVVLFTYFIILSVSSQILQKTIRDNLIETVENNYNEVKFYPSIDQEDLERDTSHFLFFEDGYLEVNDDFLDAVNSVYTALYDADLNLIYGENPVSGAMSSVKLTDSTIQTVKADGTTYYAFDRKLTAKGLENLWMRGVVSATQGTDQMANIVRLSLIILPVLVLIASLGGYFLVRKMLKPIQQISRTASEIGQENDLKKRIDLGPGTDELHQLADTFNTMFDKLERAFDAERQFISDASHELRTPMSVITAQCQLSLEHPGNPEEYVEALTVIQRQSRKMSRLISDMLDFTRLEIGTERYAMEPVDMTGLVSSICSDMALIQENHITLQYETEPDVTYTGSRTLLSRLLMNLISNAYRYGKENGHIRVRLYTEDQQVCISVADDGVGIPKEEQEKIFQRFYQSDASRTGAGIGLGLSMAREIARFHGGDITVDSTPEEGSTFTVCLP